MHARMQSADACWSLKASHGVACALPSIQFKVISVVGDLLEFASLVGETEGASRTVGDLVFCMDTAAPIVRDSIDS